MARLLPMTPMPGHVNTLAEPEFISYVGLVWIVATEQHCEYVALSSIQAHFFSYYHNKIPLQKTRPTHRSYIYSVEGLFC